jgi:hypothetical protein
MSTLARVEAVLSDAKLDAELSSLEARLPIGVRPRQCSVRTLFIGMLCCLCEGHQSAHLSAVLAALCGLCDHDKERFGVLADWHGVPHLLTYRQVTYTACLLDATLRKDRPDGAPSKLLQQLCDALVESSIPARYKVASSSYAIDWTDIASFARPPSEPDGPCADPEAGWGHRRGDQPGRSDELFFGYYGSLMTMVRDDSGPAVPELVRRVRLSSCRVDPVSSFVGVVTNATTSGVVVADVLADCGYSYKVPERFAYPLRAAGVNLVIDLHQNDRGMKGTFSGAILANGNCYCPMTPVALFALSPLPRGASKDQIVTHDARVAELNRYKLSRQSRNDDDGYHRAACPATSGKVRCPLRPNSMALGYDRPSILTPPVGEPVCCTQQSITVGPTINAKTAQRHDYLSPAWRASYGRRSAVERSNSRLKDPAGINLDVRGWCKQTGLVPLALFVACSCVVVNFGLVNAFEQRQTVLARQTTVEAPKRRARRRRTLAELASSATGPP